MALLAGTHYDPAAAATDATSSLLAMTALDTTNLRLTFTAPANGTVLVRMRGVVHGGTTTPNILFGVLDGSTVKARQIPIVCGRPGAAATTHVAMESVFLITGLTPSSSYTYDAAYGVEQVVASSAIKLGGPDDTTTDNAFGGFSFEIWEATNLLAGTLYDPAAAVSKATSSRIAMTALDTTNLRLGFTTATTGAGSTSVLVRLRGGAVTGATTYPAMFLGVLDGSTIKGRAAPLMGTNNTGSITTTNFHPCAVEFLVTGLTANTAYTWDAAYGVDVLIASTNLRYGGPNNTTVDDAFGGFAFEVWKA